MGWTDEGISRSRQDLLDRVRRRGDQLRARRRVATLAALPVLLLAVLVPAALSSGGTGSTTVAASSPTGTGPAPTLLLPSSTAVAEVTTSTAPTTIAVAPTSTTRPAAATTVAPTTVPTTLPEQATTTTTTVPTEPPGPFCNPPKFTSTAQTDKPSYRPGDLVRATATWTNTSGEACWYRYGYWGNWVVDSADRIVTPQAWPPFDNNEWRPVAPGETMSHSWGWDLTVCSANNTTACSTASPGTYKIIFDYEPFAEPTVTLQVLAPA